jgi:hypothetical protein
MQPGEKSMKALLVVAAALTTVAALATVPALPAQARGYYHNDNVNRDFQLSGARWKTNHKQHKPQHTSK